MHLNLAMNLTVPTVRYGHLNLTVLHLPFGPQSAPCVSTVYVVTAIDPSEYNVQFLVHYIDNFLTTSPPDSFTPPVHQCSG